MRRAAAIALCLLAGVQGVHAVGLSILPDVDATRRQAQGTLGQQADVGCVSPRAWPGAQRYITEAGQCTGELAVTLECAPGTGQPGQWITTYSRDTRDPRKACVNPGGPMTTFGKLPASGPDPGCSAATYPGIDGPAQSCTFVTAMDPVDQCLQRLYNLPECGGGVPF